MRKLTAVVVMLGAILLALPAPAAADGCDWNLMQCLESGADESHCQEYYCLCRSQGFFESLWCMALN